GQLIDINTHDSVKKSPHPKPSAPAMQPPGPISFRTDRGHGGQSAFGLETCPRGRCQPGQPMPLAKPRPTRGQQCPPSLARPPVLPPAAGRPVWPPCTSAACPPCCFSPACSPPRRPSSPTTPSFPPPPPANNSAPMRRSSTTPPSSQG